MATNWICQLFLALLGVIHITLGAYIGVNIGTQLSNMPSASDVVKILQQHQISHVRLFDADSRMLKALANTSIEVMVSVTNQEVLGIAQSPSKAASWFKETSQLTHLKPT